MICHLCPPGDNAVNDAEMLNHLRVVHPEQYGDGPDCWPDGEVVLHDMTLTPSDFTKEIPDA